jgi:hypothetical protein
VTGNAVSSNALTVRQFGTGNVFSAQTTTGSTALFVGANGNVGVGTANPQNLLQLGTGVGTPGSVPSVVIFNGNMCTAQHGSFNFVLNDSTDVNVTKYLTFAITGSGGYQCSIDLVIESFGYGDIVDRLVFRFTLDASCRSDGSGGGATISPISTIGSGASGITIVGATVTASTSQVRVSFLRNTSLYAPWNFNALYTFRGINGVACTGVSFA